MIEDLKVLDTTSLLEFQRKLKEYGNEWYWHTDLKVYTIYNSFERQWDNTTHYFALLTKYKEDVNPENVKGELSWIDWDVQSEEWGLQEEGKITKETVSTTTTSSSLHEEMREVSVSDMFNSVFVPASKWEDLQSTVEWWDWIERWAETNLWDSDETQMLTDWNEDVSVKESDDSEVDWTLVKEDIDSDA